MKTDPAVAKLYRAKVKHRKNEILNMLSQRSCVNYQIEIAKAVLI